MKKFGKKLQGTKQEFSDHVKKDQAFLSSIIWDWTDNILVNGYGELYLTDCMNRLESNIGKPGFSEVREDIKHMGPDNYQLNLGREYQSLIKSIWWKLVKYQYNVLKDNGTGITRAEV